MKMIGVELYFDDLEGAKRFYCDALGLTLSDEEAGHHAQFDAGAGFLCLERKGVESYPSRDKAVLFFEVDDLNAAVKAVGPERVVQWEKKPGRGTPWAVFHDPEGHNVLLLQEKR